ncbi:AEC family transporter [Alphaproteobacteria bacterium]|nr:AEC family transporter [Alphaproteobacteria bacterium]
MLSLLLNSFLPVAFLILLGFVSAKKKVFDYKQSLAILKYVGVVAVPALTLKMIISINLSNLNWILLSGYILSELIIYIIAALLAKYIFKFEWHECILIGMAASFANHLLFVYPIALNEYDETLIAPIISIIGFDVVFLVINLVILDLITLKNMSSKNIVLKQFTNLPLIALLVGLLIILVDIKLPIAFSRSLEFISGSAAPCALFAAGIILAQKLEKTQLRISNLIILFKVVLHPLLAILIIWNINSVKFSTSETTIMVAAAPVGLMALIFSTQYGVNPSAITRALMITTLLSILTIPLSSTLS